MAVVVNVMAVDMKQCPLLVLN